MEKKGDFLNQIAIIIDLIEKINIETYNASITINTSENEFYRLFDAIQKKYNYKTEKPKDTFKMSIGSVDVILNKNNV